MSEGTARTPANLPDDPALLKQMIFELRAQIEKLRYEMDPLRRMHFGPRSERLVAEQMTMPFAAQPFPAELPPPGPPSRASGAHATATATKPGIAGHGRQLLPEHLKRVTTTLDVPEEEKRCRGCKTKLRQIGEDSSEQLEYKPAQLFVNREVRPKYVCPNECEETAVVQSAPSLGPIEKGLPGPGLLAQVCVSKFDDHLPAYRQTEIFARQGVHIARSTLCDWIGAAADLLGPLVLLMRKQLLTSKKVHTDDVPVPVQDETRPHTREARLWVYLGDERAPYVVFEYSPNHSEVYPIEFLKDFLGFLQCDAYRGYDEKKIRAIVVGCWVHARRYFFDAQKSDPERAAKALGYIHRLYEVEREAKDLTTEARRALRQERSKPAIDEFRSWLDAEELSVLPRSALGEAFTYARNQWTRLTRYLEDGDLDIDNNAAERENRNVAIGRKNWLFAGSDEGGKRAAILYSVIQSAKRSGLEPWAYLTDLLSRIATHPDNRLAELLPDRWKPPPNTS